jgi:hypothetical protein
MEIQNIKDLKRAFKLLSKVNKAIEIISQETLGLRAISQSDISLLDIKTNIPTEENYRFGISVDKIVDMLSGERIKLSKEEEKLIVEIISDKISKKVAIGTFDYPALDLSTYDPKSYIKLDAKTFIEVIQDVENLANHAEINFEEDSLIIRAGSYQKTDSYESKISDLTGKGREKALIPVKYLSPLKDIEGEITLRVEEKKPLIIEFNLNEWLAKLYVAQAME